MKKVFFLTLFFILAGCSAVKKPLGKYQIIDIESSVGDYQRIYASDFFSSFELVPLETNINSLIGGDPIVLANDSFIIIGSVIKARTVPVQRNLHVFNRSGKFLNQIGSIGRGPGEYIGILNFFLDHEKPNIYVDDSSQILEYELSGKFIGTIPIPIINGFRLWNIRYIGDNLFFGAPVSYVYASNDNYYIFDRNGNIVKYFPNHFFYNAENQLSNSMLKSGPPFKIDKQLYVWDNINDTIYTFVNTNLQPAYIFDFGEYTYPLGRNNKEGKREIITMNNVTANRLLSIINIVGTPQYLFYTAFVPSYFKKPKVREKFDAVFGQILPDEAVHGIYNIAENTNMFCDTDPYYHQNGLINDINGSLSFFPKYYAGNGEVFDIWCAYDMKEFLTEEYFASIEIKDKLAHQKLRELLRKLKEEDNPVVVIAKLK